MSDKKCAAEKKAEMEEVITQVSVDGGKIGDYVERLLLTKL